ncbi:hypothetical protein CGCSCA4_v011949 [Colletotrichum siamense]|uniref:Deoxyribonuclease NucA/NucB domain-containing protein n=1 Tax=Colletotrichum siamense TaxID=690259 RepID=A0A9P5BSI7_COLSI|nr:hypothetical protein CGCSCA4_v011949 [Colletotrichum siamense]KAF4851230.1 hypothetical protein CGCSCA2_v011040 [Colletotrichum siamense]
MEFVYISPIVAPDIPINICLGIRHKLGLSAQEIVLTYAGDGQRCSRQRGRGSGCRGCCRGVTKSSGAEAGRRTECDEFPFKSTVEGGDGAWIRCVTGCENQLQGYYLNSWYRDNNIKPDDQFIVRVSNLDCSTVQPADLQSCQNGGASTLQTRAESLESGSETAVRRTLDNKTTVVIAPFGDLDGMGYEAKARMSTGRLTQARVIDSDGDEISAMGEDNLNSLYSDDGLSIKWAFDDYVGGVGFIGETQSTSVNLTWNLQSDASGSSSDSESVASRLSFSLVSQLYIAAWFGLLILFYLAY